MIKVIKDDAVQAEVEEDDKKYRVVKCGCQIQWETVDAREEMELQLLARNKRHLQQVAKEDGIPMQEWFQKLIREDGYSEEGGRIIAGEIDWKEIPDNREIREWIRAVIRTPAEVKLPTIEGTITTN